MSYLLEQIIRGYVRQWWKSINRYLILNFTLESSGIGQTFY